MERIGSAAGDDGRRRVAGERSEAAAPAASLGTLAGCAAQAVGTPLASSRSSLRALIAGLEALAADPSGLAASLPGLRQAAEDAARGAARIGEVVRALELLCAGRRTTAREPLDVRAELAAAAELCRTAVSQRAHLSLDLPATLPRVTAPPGDVGLSVASLLLAVAETLADDLAAEHGVRVGARADGGRVVVEVAEEGTPGRQRAFDATPGLSVSRAIALAAGGTAEASAGPGRGATFTLSFPVASATGAEPAARPQPAAPSRGRVLVIDDDPLVGRSMARLLQATCEVTVLTSPVEAVSRIEQGERWDVVLCDLMMPELSGMDVEARISTSAPEMVPRVVYLTGGAFTDKARAFLGEGRPYLEKPVEASVLRTRVAELLR